MKKSKYNGKDIYWNENKERWCYMNHRPVPTDLPYGKEEVKQSIPLSTRIVNFFKGE